MKNDIELRRFSDEARLGAAKHGTAANGSRYRVTRLWARLQQWPYQEAGENAFCIFCDQKNRGGHSD